MIDGETYNYFQITPEQRMMCNHVWPQCPLYEFQVPRFKIVMGLNYPNVDVYSVITVKILDDSAGVAMCASFRLKVLPSNAQRKEKGLNINDNN